MKSLHDSLHRSHLRGALPSVAVTGISSVVPLVATRLRIYNNNFVRLRPIVEPGMSRVRCAHVSTILVLATIPWPVKTVASLNVHPCPVEVQMKTAPVSGRVAFGETSSGDVRHPKIKHTITGASQRGLIELHERCLVRQILIVSITQAIVVEELKGLASTVESAVVDERPPLLRAWVPIVQRRDCVRGIDLVNLISYVLQRSECGEVFESGVHRTFQVHSVRATSEKVVPIVRHVQGVIDEALTGRVACEVHEAIHARNSPFRLWIVTVRVVDAAAVGDAVAFHAVVALPRKDCCATDRLGECNSELHTPGGPGAQARDGRLRVEVHFELRNFRANRRCLTLEEARDRARAAGRQQRSQHHETASPR